MRTGLMPYKDITTTMKAVKRQIVDSIDFALANCPQFKNPEELFYWLKDNCRYKDDRPGVEYLRTMQTFWRDGGGDCDCMTITAVACMIANNWDNIYINIVGREKSHPVHIFPEIVWDGKPRTFDLTNRDYNYERSGYRYKQRLPVRWRTW